MAEYNVNLQWDTAAYVWIAMSDDVPGLALEAGSYDLLIERVRNIVPELLELNGLEFHDVSLCFKTERHERVIA